MSSCAYSLIELGQPEMAKVELNYSKKQVDEAGETLLIHSPEDDEYNSALQILNNWRAVHNYPLLSFRMSLAQRAKKIHAKAIVAQRIKRLPAIKLKLKLKPNLKLSRMQDIGGCRAIVPTAEHVRRVVELYLKGNTIHSLHKIDDYVFDKPKSTGYRGVHLIYHYNGSANEAKGLRIEIQIRSLIQHAWATAVETVDTFTQQALKSNIGEDDWKRFFTLMGAALAIKEGTKLVPNISPDRRALSEELKEYTTKLDVIHSLEAFKEALNIPPEIIKPGDYYFLLALDAREKSINIMSFRQDEFEKATEVYLESEKAMGSAVVQFVLEPISK